MTKSLSELSLNISEQLYRDIPCLSYSAIAKYEKNGFSAIAHLYDTQESDALLFGSVVDTLITEPDKFQEKFAIADFKKLSDSLLCLAEHLVYVNEEETLQEVPDERILAICNEFNYCAKMSDATRVERVREGCTEHYNLRKECRNKTVVTAETYQEALATVGALKNHPLIGKFLGTSHDNIEFLYQQKFKTTLYGLEVKCMTDLLIVMHDSKTIIPIDLKTSSFPEYDFPKRYLENRYDIQARLYHRILENVISGDDYFKNFTVSTFKFIVVNKNSRNPLVFRDEKCAEDGDIILTFNSGRTFTLRDPIAIGKELQEYLDNPKTVPNGIEINSSNNIYERLQLL